jgi:hypothetical protein
VPVAIVSGALANKPFNGGEAWVRLSWVLGLARLGFDTYFVEEVSESGCVDRAGRATDFHASANRAYFESVTDDFGLTGRAGLLYEEGAEAAGLGLAELEELAGDAELLINISGHLTIETIFNAVDTRVYVDLDPGFTQLWHVDPDVSFALAGHDRYVTVGLNIGKPGCRIPDCGLEWVGTLPPVLIDEWPPGPPVAAGPPRFTTVATWRSPYGSPLVGGRAVGLKHHAFRRLIELPERVDGVSFELALDIHDGDSADRRALADHGWALVEPREAAATPAGFRDYVAASTAEFSVAQGVYSETSSGWFSDRTAAYLASGRPAVVEDTGIGQSLELGDGLLTFASLGEAVAGAEAVVRDYSTHAAAATAFAARHLDSDLVLARLLSKLGIGV